MFFSNLHAQMDKMAGKLHKSELFKAAKAYLGQGFSATEAEELLTMDGYDPDLIQSCIVSLASDKAEPATGEHEWGFEVEDSYGRVSSSFDLGITIRAKNETEAMTKTEKILSGEESKPSGTITVFRL
jgi:hypothetical protein